MSSIATKIATLKDLAREGYEMFNTDNFDDIPSLITGDVELVNNAFGIAVQGSEAFVLVLRMLKSPWPDAKIHIVRQLEGDNFVINECVFSGTNTMPIINPDGSQIPATGKSFETTFCEIWCTRDMKLASLHYYGDNLGVFQQLGLIPDATA